MNILLLVALLAPARQETQVPALLVYTESAGFVHGVVKRPQPDELSLVERTISEWSKESREFEVRVSQDPGIFEPDEYGRIGPGDGRPWDAVLFYTTGELSLTDAGREALFRYVRSGGGFVGVHSATDTYYEVPEYGELIGGRFDGHPWHQEVWLNRESSDHPAHGRSAPKSVKLTDEIYQFRDWSRKGLDVLFSLDTGAVDIDRESIHRTDSDFAVAWAKSHGAGRVFYTALGHRPEVWESPWFREHLLAGMRWAMFSGDESQRWRPEVPAGFVIEPVAEGVDGSVATPVAIGVDQKSRIHVACEDGRVLRWRDGAPQELLAQFDGPLTGLELDVYGAIAGAPGTVRDTAGNTVFDVPSFDGVEPRLGPIALGRDRHLYLAASGRILRFESKAAFDVYARGLEPVELAFDATDELFAFQGQELLHVLPGANHMSAAHPLSAVATWTRDEMVPAGASFYREAAWPERYRGSLFVCDRGAAQRPGAVRRIELAERWSSYTLIADEAFLSAGLVVDFEPVDLAFSPDGAAMFVVDAGGGGRLWRVDHESSNRVDEPGITFDITKLDAPDLRSRRIAEWMAFYQNEIPALERAFANDDGGPQGFPSDTARRHALWALLRSRNKHRAEAGRVLAKCIEHPSLVVRALAARCIGQWPERVDVDLAPLLADPSPKVRREVAYAIARRGDELAAAALVEAFAKEVDPNAKHVQGQALTSIGGFDAVAERLLVDFDPELQRSLFAVFDGVHEPGAVAVLAQLIDGMDAHHTLRVKAVHQLASLCEAPLPWGGKGAALDALRGGLDSPIPAVRIACTESIVKLRDDPGFARIVERFAEEAHVQARDEIIAIVAKAEPDNRARGIYTAGLKSESEETRADCLRALEDLRR